MTTNDPIENAKLIEAAAAEEYAKIHRRVERKKKIKRAATFLGENRLRITEGALVMTASIAAIFIRAKINHDKFLKEKGLYEEYYERVI